MSENKHTPEPWFDRDPSDDPVDEPRIFNAEGLQIAHVYKWDDFSLTPDERTAIQKSNARRIVACVNACAGIPTDALESGVARQVRDEIEAAVKLEKQRDELLAALEKIANKCELDMHSDDGSLGGYAYGIWNTANTAITSAKGGAA